MTTQTKRFTAEELEQATHDQAESDKNWLRAQRDTAEEKLKEAEAILVKTRVWARDPRSIMELRAILGDAE